MGALMASRPGPVGVTALEGADAGPVPAAFIALTVNVYAVPAARPVTVAFVADHVHRGPAGAAGVMATS